MFVPVSNDYVLFYFIRIKKVLYNKKQQQNRFYWKLGPIKVYIDESILLETDIKLLSSDKSDRNTSTGAFLFCTIKSD